MMTLITDPTANLFTSGCAMLVCPVNTVGVMGGGLAYAFRRKFPGLEAYYRSLCQTKEIRIGRCGIYWASRGPAVLLFPTKLYWRDPSTLHFIVEGLMHFAACVPSTGVESVAMPALGCGLGGLMWEEVYPLIEQYCANLPIDMRCYPPHEGVHHTPGSTVPVPATAAHLQSSQQRRDDIIDRSDVL